MKDPPPKGFQERIDSYMKLRKLAIRDITPLKQKAEPSEIEQYRKAVATAIRGARTGAKQGDILTPAIQTFLTKIVRSEMKGKDGISAKKTVKQGNPRSEPDAVPVQVEVNAFYPESAPASSVPPTLLLRLPKLPEELDFRFVGRHMLLRDTAGLIIDFVPNATLP